MKESLTKETLEAFQNDFRANTLHTVAKNAVTVNGLLKSSRNSEAARSTRHEFSISLEQGEITNQMQSGRCWMFAALNTFRFEVIKKLNLETFELSQNYTLFYDKLEKANYFLESILDTLKEPVNGRLISHLLTDPLGDGGQWDMLCSIIRKYGLVPKDAMPETACSSATREMAGYMTKKLREFACTLRKANESGASIDELRMQKESMMNEIYRILCICLGEPPKTFDFEVRDKDKNFHRDTQITPQQFYEKYIGLNLDDYISLINAPTSDKPYHRSYSVKYLGNVKEGRPVRYLNLEIEELKKAAIAQMQDGSPVWFGCDVGKYSCGENGVMDLDLYQTEELLGTTYHMTKAERLDYHESLMTHAMTFMGVNLDENGNPDRWRVENSWGEKSGKKGYYVMSDVWFDEYMYQVVVNKKYLPEQFVKEYESEPILLEPWDPMGSLAL
ncbi:aminopeptidase C [Faecalimonas umbilicata]|uniref:aminopeptidase C n=1 Tax=Faecalimonas umbilicata TaxID=1912855 RepID=UPI000E4167D2|nr:C1 family peptidase [Faecalimonas umbilicata]RGC78352.1 aminopeptidase [Lachnospiraceae bacterium AM25-17]RJU69322.1 aminopeptidase [Coprococcus sp. AM27-12LB]